LKGNDLNLEINITSIYNCFVELGKPSYPRCEFLLFSLKNHHFGGSEIARPTSSNGLGVCHTSFFMRAGKGNSDFLKLKKCNKHLIMSKTKKRAVTFLFVQNPFDVQACFTIK
jgi:hypothetical protein